MKNCCDSCKFSKTKGNARYCVKYGITVFSPRVFCIAFERDVRDGKIRKQENFCGWDDVRQPEGGKEMV